MSVSDTTVNSTFKLGVVVPAYNEELLIGDTIQSIPDYVDRIYVVDDCSADHTGEVVRSFADPRLALIRHEKNKGVGGAISTGYKQAVRDGMDIAIVMAGDNQMDPAYLMSLVRPVMAGQADYTKGNRLINASFRNGMSAWRSLGNYMLTFLNKIASGYWHVEDPQNGYTAISSKALEMLDLDNIYQGYAFENDMLVRLNVFDGKVLNVPIPARYGKERSKIRYIPFIFKTSAYLVNALAWRIWNKYLVKLRPVGIFYLLGILLMAAGLVVLLYDNYIVLLAGAILFIAAVLIEAIADRRHYRKMRGVRQ
jgi:glycosyltransferase involved in cell wall biosynthesis